ncbi:MAG: ABC transporter permease [Spirochaetales bacterium]
MNNEKLFDGIRAVSAVFIALIIAVIIIFFVSNEPSEALARFILGPLTSISHIGNVVEMAIPLAFTGLYYTVLFKANLFNLGAEGVFFSSALFSAILAVNLPFPPGLNPIVIMLSGATLGAIIGCIPCFFNIKWGANALVVSLMMNNILYGIGMFLLNNHFRDFSAYAIVTHPFQESARLTTMIPQTRIHWGLAVLIIVCVALTFFIRKTTWGYEIRMMGINKKFATYSGMKSIRIMFLTYLIAGFTAGLGGSVEILGMYRKFQWTSLPGYGLDGVLVALLAKSNPATVPAAAIFLAYIRIGADMMSRMSDVPAEMISIVQALIILLISSQMLFKNIKQRILLKQTICDSKTIKGNA